MIDHETKGTQMDEKKTRARRPSPAQHGGGVAAARIRQGGGVIPASLKFESATNPDDHARYAHVYSKSASVQVVHYPAWTEEGSDEQAGCRVSVNVRVYGDCGHSSWGFGESLEDALQDAAERMRERCAFAHEHYVSTVEAGAAS